MILAEHLNNMWKVVILSWHFWLSDQRRLSFALLICFRQLSDRLPSVSSTSPVLPLISIPLTRGVRLQRVKARTETAAAWGRTSLIHIHPHLAGAGGGRQGRTQILIKPQPCVRAAFSVPAKQWAELAFKSTLAMLNFQPHYRRTGRVPAFLQYAEIFPLSKLGTCAYSSLYFILIPISASLRYQLNEIDMRCVSTLNWTVERDQ